jgi:N-acetylglutamate synthase-like GNAT family acetyltransferase
VAILNSQVVGFVGLIVKEEEVEIEPLIVSQPYHNRGIGKRLIETVIAAVNGLHIKYLSVKPVT